MAGRLDVRPDGSEFNHTNLIGNAGSSSRRYRKTKRVLFASLPHLRALARDERAA